MTPQPELADSAPLHDAHLTEAQFGEFLAGLGETDAAASTPTEVHLLNCEQCAAELATLRSSLSLFRQAASVYAESELRRLPRMSLPARNLYSPSLMPVYWIAAAAMLFAALLPIKVLHRRADQLTPARASSTAVAAADHSIQSDEALLEDINRETSLSVPPPMQALADPTASTTTSIQNATEKKD